MNTPNSPNPTELIDVFDGKQLFALAGIINEVRMLKAWDVLPAGKADAYARVWAKVLNIAGVEPQYYPRLYKKAIERQLYCRQKGFDVPEITADFLASQWTVLEDEIKTERVKSGRVLTSNAESQCPRCFGLSKENIFDEQTGRILGVKGTCDHRALVEGEWLWKKRHAQILETCEVENGTLVLPEGDFARNRTVA